MLGWQQRFVFLNHTINININDTYIEQFFQQIKAQQAQQIAKTLKEMYQDKVAQLEAKLNAQTELLKACQRKQQLAEEELVHITLHTFTISHN